MKSPHSDLLIKTLIIRVHKLPNMNTVVCIASKKSRSICRPGKTSTDWWLGLLLGFGVDCRFDMKILYQYFVFQIPNLYGWTSGSTKPIASGREAERIYFSSAGQGIKVLSRGQVPEHGIFIFSTAGTKCTIRRNCYIVYVTSMSEVIGL